MCEQDGRVAAGWQCANRVAIYRVCEHSCNIECANRVAMCEQGGSVRTGWQGGSVRTGWQYIEYVNIVAI